MSLGLNYVTMPPTVVLLHNSGRSLLHFTRIPRVLENLYFIIPEFVILIRPIYSTQSTHFHTKFYDYINGTKPGLKFISVCKVSQLTLAKNFSVNFNDTKKWLRKKIYRYITKKHISKIYRDAKNFFLKIITQYFLYKTFSPINKTKRKIFRLWR